MVQYSFLIPLLQKLKNRQVLGWDLSISYVFLHYKRKTIPEYIFVKYQNQLRPMSILSHTGGADLGSSRLAATDVTQQKLSTFGAQFFSFG